MQYELRPIEDSDMDSMFILPLSIVPLETVSLRGARLIKNGRLQSVVELFRDDKTGSGQMDIEALPQRFNWNPDETHPDHAILRRLALLPSYDVYSLRISLREAGIPVNDFKALRLSPEKAEELSRYMVAFTRPLLKLVFADEGMDIQNYNDVLNLFRDPDTRKVRDRLEKMARELAIDITEVPKFLEDYGDTFLSLSYFSHCLDRLSPYIAACMNSIALIKTNFQCKQNDALMKACVAVESATTSLRDGIVKRLKMIEERTQKLFSNMNQKEFRSIKEMIEREHVTIGAILCGLTVKMDIFGRMFPHENAGGPVKRGDFILNDMIKGIDTMRKAEMLARGPRPAPAPGPTVVDEEAEEARKYWESIFEEKLIPLVRTATNPTVLEVYMSHLIDSLFQRDEDDDNKQNFRHMLATHVKKSDDFAERLQSAIAFIQKIKKARIDLAIAALNKPKPGARRIDDGKPHGMSSDLSAVAAVSA